MEYIDGGQASLSEYNFISEDSSIWTSSPNYTCDAVNPSSATPEVINTTEVIPNMASWLNITTGTRTGIYILTLYRNPSVEAVYVETSVKDANGSVIIPHTKVWIGETTPTDTSAWQRRVGLGKFSDPRLLVPVTRYRRGYRRKGKSGSGGGSKAGPSASGFSSKGIVGGRGYGYSSSTTNSRFVGGTFTRRPYGVTGRTVVVGSTFFMLMSMRGGYGHRYCNRYSSSQRASCQSRYSNNCTAVNADESQCGGITSTDVIRDDLMADTAFDADNVAFPLTLTISRLAVVLKSGATQLDDWDKPVFYGFSEVNVDPPSEEDDIAAVLIILGIVLGLGCCCAAGAWVYTWWNESRTTTRRVTPEVDMRRRSSTSLYSSRRTTRHDRDHRSADFKRPVAHPPNCTGIQDSAPPKYEVTGPPSPTCTHMLSAVPIASIDSHPPQFMTFPQPLAGYPPPSDNSTEGSAYALPPDWQMVTETDPSTHVPTGRVYYHNIVTNETSWTYPQHSA